MKVSTVFFLSFLATTSTSTCATNADAVQYDDVHRLRANNDDNNHARRLDDCVSASQAVCGLGDTFSMMCEFIKDMNLDSYDTYTLFLPDDYAFSLMQDSLEKLSDAEVDRVLKFHVYQDIQLSYNELRCGETLTAITGDTSRTKCDKGHGVDLKHQNGAGNTKQESLPTITDTDIEFCNGMAHTLDHLMLPRYLEEHGIIGPDEPHHKNHPGKTKSGGSYCTWSPDTDCWNGGWPACCRDTNTPCPDKQPACDSSSPAYCIWGPNYDCYEGGWPACCLEDYLGCPGKMPECEKTEKPVGASYCVYAPDSGCYKNGWPECCLDNGGATCPTKQPECNFQCGRTCSSRSDCQTNQGVWDPGMPWCGGICDSGECQPTWTTCSSDDDCGDNICGPGLLGGNGDRYCVGKQPYERQCGRNCSGNYDCANDNGDWDSGSPWCGICKDGYCRPHIQDCNNDNDCDDNDKAVCGPTLPGTNGRYCVGK